MPYTIEYDKKIDCIYTSMTGEVDLDTVREYRLDVAQVLQDNNCQRILNDLRQAKLIIPLADMYSFPREVGEGFVGLFPKRALVYRNDEIMLQFFEVTSRNQGLSVRVFDDYDKAKRWLLSDLD